MWSEYSYGCNLYNSSKKGRFNEGLVLSRKPLANKELFQVDIYLQFSLGVYLYDSIIQVLRIGSYKKQHFIVEVLARA